MPAPQPPLKVLPTPAPVARAPRASGRVRVLTRKPEDGDVTVLAKDDIASNQIQDPFHNSYESDPLSVTNVLRPPYKMETLKMLPMRNAILLQCIHAMVTNCHTFGWQLTFIGEKGQEETPASKAEKVRIENLLNFPNGTDSFGNIRVKSGTDFETLGNAYWECGRNARGNVDFFYHVPAERVRLCKMDENPVDVKVTIMREGQATVIKMRRYFRRFVQIVGTKKVYFKEFGDPRSISPKTGNEEPGLALEDQATEILHIPQYWSGSPYGVPCWVNNLPAILGMREAEMVNLGYFEDNAIPAMAVLVSGGSLADDTLLELQEKFVARKGRDQINRVVVIEAVADLDAAGNTDTAPAAPKLELKPLRDAQQGDGLFLAYEEASMTKIRGSFRLPPIYVGRSDDYTRATAESSAQLAEGQVFTPRRSLFDDMLNTKVLVHNSQPPEFWNFRSNASRLIDPALILQALIVLESVGAATPNLSIQIANDLFGLNIPPITEDWGNKPFEFVKAELAKDLAKASKPQLEPGKEGEQEPPAKNTPPTFGKLKVVGKEVEMKKDEELHPLTTAMMAIGQYIDERGRLDAIVRTKAKEKVKIQKATNYRE